jgi:hypothetical protein
MKLKTESKRKATRNIVLAIMGLTIGNSTLVTDVTQDYPDVVI